MPKLYPSALCAAPFAAWMVLMSVLPATAESYAVRSLATAAVAIAAWSLAASRGDGAALWSKERLRLPFGARVAIGAAAGVAVAVAWIAPEGWEWYRVWCCWPIGAPPEQAGGPSPYDPAVCGVALTALRLVGSAFVIAPVEEIFFRSFLYRRLQDRNFAAIPISRFDASAFLWTVFLFSLEHDRLAVAAVAGAAYGALAIRFGIASAIVAHVVTNFVLGVYVIAGGHWAFW